MFGQQINPFASAAKWLFFGFFGIVFMAILLGFNFKDATWLNSDIATAEAERIQIETAHQQADYQLQERLAAAQTDAEIKQIEREQKLLDAQYEHDIQALTQDLQQNDVAFKTSMNLLNTIGNGVAVAIVIAISLWAGSKALITVRSVPSKTMTMPPTTQHQPVPEYKPIDPWNSPNYRYQKRIAAQQRERQERKEITSRMNVYRDPASMGKEEYRRRPLAG